MVVEGIHLTVATFGDKSAVLRIPVGLSYLSLPVAAVLMGGYVARQTLTVWRSQNGWAATAETEED
jgi:TRAP-type C4-dicarboxylate transport system permease small subunit